MAISSSGKYLFTWREPCALLVWYREQSLESRHGAALGPWVPENTDCFVDPEGEAVFHEIHNEARLVSEFSCSEIEPKPCKGAVKAVVADQDFVSSCWSERCKLFYWQSLPWDGEWGFVLTTHQLCCLKRKTKKRTWFTEWKGKKKNNNNQTTTTKTMEIMCLLVHVHAERWTWVKKIEKWSFIKFWCWLLVLKTTSEKNFSKIWHGKTAVCPESF